MNEMTMLAINTLIAKIYLRLAFLDLSDGIQVSYTDGSIKVHIRGRTHTLTHTDSPSLWCLDGRRNWRAIKSLCLIVHSDGEPPQAPEKAPRKPKVKPEPIQLPPDVEAVQIPPAAIDGLPDDWQKAIPEGLMTSKEAKAQLKTAGNKKGEPKPSPELNHAPSESVTPAASRSAADILNSLSGSAKSGSKRAPQQHRANKRRPR